MSHDSTRVMRVKNPAERFCEVISGVQDFRAMYELNLLSFFLILDREIRDIKVPRALRRTLRIHHLNGGHVMINLFENVRETCISK